MIDRLPGTTVEIAVPNAEVAKDILDNAFLCGGLLCVIGQIFIDKTKLTPARILVSYVVIGVILGAIGIYKPFLEFAGAGASVPLTGFGANLAKGVKEAVDKQGFLGIFTGGLKNCAAGITVASSTMGMVIPPSIPAPPSPCRCPRWWRLASAHAAGGCR